MVKRFLTKMVTHARAFARVKQSATRIDQSWRSYAAILLIALVPLSHVHAEEVIAWGDNQEGQSTIPSGVSNVVAIAAGNSHSLALSADGRVVAWGRNYEFELASGVLRGLCTPRQQRFLQPPAVYPHDPI